MAEPKQTNSDATETPSRFVVGIDLGTTNSAVAYIDTSTADQEVRILAIPQTVAPGECESRPTLPSFHYEPASGELPPSALQLPWDDGNRGWSVGVFAREQGAKTPGRLVDSAKSWLCHNGVDRTSPLLPWRGASDVTRLSPVEASSRYLQQIREAWDHQFPHEPLVGQEIVLTLPASFDEVARELTVRAARGAGLPRVVLVEEPQAAFYAWIHAHQDDWPQLVSPGDTILVCDIGGGTSDFTLIRVRQAADAPVQFHRVAVGEHLILGGDNLDLSLAHHLEPRLAGAGRKLSPQQWGTLRRRCRQVKELLLGADPPDSTTVHIPGGGSRLIGGALQTEVTRAEVEKVLVEGFLPRVGLEDQPQARRSGFQEFSLPYATDAAMTRYLAHFLSTHRFAGLDPEATGNLSPSQYGTSEDPGRPDIVLFNGGFFESPVLRGRLIEVLSSWFNPTGTPLEAGWSPRVLDHQRLDLAVAQGAAYYGLVRRGLGVRIAAGLPRTYYIGVAEQAPGSTEAASWDALQGVCLLPAGIEEGQQVDLSQRKFELLIHQPVEFPLLVSSTRLTDRPGELVTVDPEKITPLPPIRTVLATRKSGQADHVTVQLHARLTEIGTVELWCEEVAGKRSWRLQFDVRSTTQTDVAAHQGTAEQAGFVEEATASTCRDLIRQAMITEAIAPKELIERLEEAVGENRWQWPPSLLRELWEMLLEVEQGRERSSTHEARWLNLLGFSLRPGYGLAVDDWRVAQTWKLFQTRKLRHPETQCRIEYLILWRRIGGGLLAGQQQALAEPLISILKPHLKSASDGRLSKSLRVSGKDSTGGRKSSSRKQGQLSAAGRGSGKAKTKGGAGKKVESPSPFGYGSHETGEAWRLLGSLELLPTSLKVQLGRLLVLLLEQETNAALRVAELWALGRLGIRVPLYGPINTTLNPMVVEPWVEQLLTMDPQAQDDQGTAFCLMQLCRRTGDRYRDVDENLREATLNWLRKGHASNHFLQLVEQGGDLAEEEAGQAFGESLPTGLRLR